MTSSLRLCELPPYALSSAWCIRLRSSVFNNSLPTLPQVKEASAGAQTALGLIFARRAQGATDSGEPASSGPHSGAKLDLASAAASVEAPAGASA